MTRSSLMLLSCTALLACVPDGEKPPRPGHRRDALSNSVVISEVYGGGATGSSAYRYDFVELFNRGTAAVDVSGWSVQYASDTGGGWQVNSLGNFGMLQPGRSLLVRLGTAGTTGAALPTPDVTGGSLMSATAGKVALVNSTTALTGTCPAASNYVDLVGYGTTANCSEGNPTPNTSATTSASRAGNGCTETDSNASDFTVGTPSPRSSSASAITCGVNPVDAGCLTIATWTTATSNGGYDPSSGTTWGELASPPNADGGVDLLTLEAYFGFGLTLPATETYTTASSYGTCEVCASLSRGCDDAGTCAREYFSQGGSGSITVADRDAGSGHFTGSLTAVRFVEWDFVSDQPVPGGECVELGSQNLDVTWGTGGGGGATGGGGGSAMGGGAGGGSATGGGGGAATGGGGGSATGGGSAAGGGGGETDAGTTEPDAGTGGGNDKLGGTSGCGCTTGGEASLVLLLAGAALRRRR